MTLAVAVLVASLLGSVHCAAMCGAFVCFYSSRAAGVASSPRQEAGVHAAYNLGRLVSYVALGVAAGALGRMIDSAGALAGIQRAAAIVAGMLMVAWGGHAVLVASGAPVKSPSAPAGWRRAMGHVLLRLQAQPPAIRAAATGLATTLLPCGWLYAFVVTASAAGTPARGALVMVLFWVGTLPMMLAVGFGVRRVMGRFGPRMPVLSGAAVVVLGLLTIVGRFGAPAAHVMRGMP